MHSENHLFWWEIKWLSRKAFFTVQLWQIVVMTHFLYDKFDSWIHIQESNLSYKKCVITTVKLYFF